MRLRLVLLAASMVLAMPSFATDELRMVPVFRHGTTYDTVTDMVAADVDGDNVTELVLCSGQAPVAVSARAGTYAAEWQGASVGCEQLAVGDRDLDGGLDVIVVAGNRLMVFDPRRLSGPAATVTLPGTAFDVAIGNVDGDGAREIVVAGDEATYVYDAATLALQWNADGYGGSSVRLADVDGSSVSEIVLNGSSASVLDAVAETQKWGYVGGFGEHWDTGNLDADAKDEIVFYGDGVMTILSGDTFGTVTWPATGEYFGLTVGDGNGDGTNEIVAGREPEFIKGFRPADGVELWSVTHAFSATEIVLANLDGDGSLEVVAMLLGSYYYSSAIFIVDRDSGATEWQSPKTEGTYRVATGDLDGDGRTEYVVSTLRTGNGYAPGRFEIFDAATHVLKSTIEVPDSYYGMVQNLAIAQADADPALEIVAIVFRGPNLIMSWDGVTGELEFTSNEGGTSFLTVLTAANLDGDAVDELIVATSDEKLLVLNGASNFVQKTLQFPGDVRDVAVADLDGDADLDLVVASYYEQLTAYDTTTWAVLGQAAFNNVIDIDATPAGGGTVVAISSYSGMAVLKGATLTPGYSCNVDDFQAAAFGEIAGETRLLAATPAGRLALYPLEGGSCPDPLPAGTLAAANIARLDFADATGDGREDLLVSSQYAAHIALVGVSSELRGDVDGDEVISTSDLDAAADYLFDGAPGISPSSDANADERIGVEDLFLLIDHELGSGAALPESALPSVQ